MNTEKWEDFYTPVDFYAKAQGIAKKFSKKNPDVDRELVYLAASDAAERYERSEQLRMKFKFKIWCYYQIKTAVYIAERRANKSMTNELKAAIIADYEQGVKPAALVEKYGLNRNTITSNLTRWKKAGLIKGGAGTENAEVSAPAQSEKADKPQAEESGAFSAVTMACSMREAAERYLRAAFGACETTYMHVYEEGCEIAVVRIRANGGRYEVAIRKED